MAAPLTQQDAIPDLDDTADELTAEQQALWDAEQSRLATHWAAHLGLAPLRKHPEGLTWHSADINSALEATLRTWA